MQKLRRLSALVLAVGLLAIIVPTASAATTCRTRVVHTEYVNGESLIRNATFTVTGCWTDSRTWGTGITLNNSTGYTTKHTSYITVGTRTTFSFTGGWEFFGWHYNYPRVYLDRGSWRCADGGGSTDRLLLCKFVT